MQHDPTPIIHSIKIHHSVLCSVVRHCGTGSPSLVPGAQVVPTRDPGPGESRIIPGPSQVPLGPRHLRRHLIKFVRLGYLHSRRGASGGASRGTGAHKQRCNRGVHCRITSGIEIGLKKAFSMFSRFLGAFFALKNLFVRNRPGTQVSQVHGPGTQSQVVRKDPE